MTIAALSHNKNIAAYSEQYCSFVLLAFLLCKARLVLLNVIFPF